MQEKGPLLIHPSVLHSLLRLPFFSLWFGSQSACFSSLKCLVLFDTFINQKFGKVPWQKKRRIKGCFFLKGKVALDVNTQASGTVCRERAGHYRAGNCSPMLTLDEHHHSDIWRRDRRCRRSPQNWTLPWRPNIHLWSSMLRLSS